MADVTTYLADIAALPDVLAVGTHELVDTDSAGVSLCQVPVTEVNEGGTAAIRKTRKFYVIDYGIPATENCYDFKAVPEPELNPAQKWVDTILDYLYDNSLANYAEVLGSDNVRKRAHVRVYIETTATEYEVKELIGWKPNGAPPEIRYLP